MKKLLIGVGATLALVLMNSSIEAKDYAGKFTATHLWGNVYMLYCTGNGGECGSTYVRKDGNTIFRAATTGDEYLLTSGAPATDEDFSIMGEVVDATPIINIGSGN